MSIKMLRRVMSRVTILLSMSIAALAANAEVYVIANAAGITPADLRDIYMGDKQFTGSQKLDPVNNSAAMDEFLQKVIKLDAAKYNTAWTKKSFRDGVNLLPTKTSDIEVIEYVKRTPGAIGYVSSEPKGLPNVVGKF